jgi:two-component system CheB/CheR fusion protein
MPKNQVHHTENGPRRPLGRQTVKRFASPERHSPIIPIVGIGASAGGLEACRKLVSMLPAGNGMAFILVQHLDPAHESMMVDLLSTHTAMTVCEATDGMKIERDHLYVIPPGKYLSVADGSLRLSQPQVRHGARLPFDFLLHSLAADRGAGAICVILSGTGTDGTLGLRSIKDKLGLVIAQDPAEAGYDGMPLSAIGTGSVDLVLPLARMPAAFASFSREMSGTPNGAIVPLADAPPDALPGIIDLLRTKTPHDFTLYKQGTLRRRIERRMALAAIPASGLGRYLTMLRNDPAELDVLAKDLLINVTNFFRDPGVFKTLADKIIPDLVRQQTNGQPIRVWIAGCSTGEETYSLAMLFHEQIALTGATVKLQVFASDIDPDAVESARDGVYPATIEADVSPERLARFFTKEGLGYRVSPDLRASVVFSVQDVLTDPPFSRIDMVSCRNLLIYLLPEAQLKVISLFHFALREGGILLLGNSETAGEIDGRFEIVSKSERLYRHIGRRHVGEPIFSLNPGEGPRNPGRQLQPPGMSRQAALAELCRRLVLETHAPAAVLINSKMECQFSLGPTDQYLRVPPGLPTQDLLAMARQDLRTRLRGAIHQVTQDKTRVTVPGGRTIQHGLAMPFNIDVQPVADGGEGLMLVCFVDAPVGEPARDIVVSPRESPGTGALETELEVTRAELQNAIRNLELSNEEQKAVNEEALSIQEEYQSTNEELVTSKEELQSLNEELTALNSQLHETLERQRTTSNDLKNVLYSTDVATIFLDAKLNIRFFTPATRLLFSILPSDVGRPLADLSSLAADGALLNDARTVLRTSVPREREIEARTGSWFVRRILPYRTQDDQIEGVVITFSDITVRTHAADALGVAKRQAEQASVAKSRFLAAASHDLRQPLQTLVLLQEALALQVVEPAAQKLLGRLDQALGAMSGMLNALLDINQIEAGTVHAAMINFPVNDLLARLRDEFAYHAQAKDLVLHMVPCSLTIRSDPGLLEQMIRNLLSNALKYTKEGKILIGCRRHNDMLSIEIWDTGIGIPEEELQAIFEEYHQLGNVARERDRGLGLGLSIVQRLGKLMGHRVRVRSRLGEGSMFAIEIALQAKEAAPRPDVRPPAPNEVAHAGVPVTGEILIVEDDPEMLELLAEVLKGAGHRVVTAPDGMAALELVIQGRIRPDLVLADFNLPNGMDGLQTATKVRERLRREIPVVILTGDISTGTLRDVAFQHYARLSKPIRSRELLQIIADLLSVVRSGMRAPRPAAAVIPSGPVVYIIDDDSNIRDELRTALEADGHAVEDFATSEAFLDSWQPGREACVLIDAYLPGMNGLELLRWIKESHHVLPAIVITGHGDVPIAVDSMKAGASDFIEKPIGGEELLASVARALDQARSGGKRAAWHEDAVHHIEGLTTRQREIMGMVLAGHPSKNIAANLGISQRTVENHRASIMKKTGAKSLPALARLMIAATEEEMVDAVPVQALTV